MMKITGYSVAMMGKMIAELVKAGLTFESMIDEDTEKWTITLTGGF